MSEIVQGIRKIHTRGVAQYNLIDSLWRFHVCRCHGAGWGGFVRFGCFGTGVCSARSCVLDCFAPVTFVCHFLYQTFGAPSYGGFYFVGCHIWACRNDAQNEDLNIEKTNALCVCKTLKAHHVERHQFGSKRMRKGWASICFTSIANLS